MSETGHLCRCLCYTICFFLSVPLDDYNEKMVLSVEGVRVSRHKDIHPEDSDDPADIGLSSEEEADGLEEIPHIRRKYHHTPQPPPPNPEQPPAGGDGPSTSTGGETATIQVPVAALQEVHKILGQIIGGETPQIPFSEPQPQQSEGDIPFAVPKPKKGEKSCKLCFRKFWATETLRRHMKTHTGDQKHTCPNPGCGRKLASKRGLKVHLETCQKEKTLFCTHKNCNKLFATQAGLTAHSKTHRKLRKDANSCKGCGKAGFTRQKSLDDHYRTCSGNPDRVGPFPCPVPGCRRGEAKPFNRVRNLNVHLKTEHEHDSKHG